MAEPDFRNERELKVWLEDKPLEWAQVIAHRAAMRVLPIVAREWRIDAPTPKSERLTLAIFRANLISRVALMLPTRDVTTFASASAAHLTKLSPSPISAVRVACEAAALADRATSAVRSTVSARKSAARATNSASVAAAMQASASIWRIVLDDAEWLMDKSGGHASDQVAELLSEPLWNGRAPNWSRGVFDRLVRATGGGDSNWAHWTGWYSAVTAFDGGTTSDYFSQALELKIAEQPDEWWKRGAEAVNADIARWVGDEAISSARSDPEKDLEKTTVDIEFTSENELKVWLEDKPIEWGRVIAHRAAMRVLPMISDEWRADPPIEQRQGLTLAVFRANLISRVAGVYPTRDMSKYADAASSAASRATDRATFSAAHYAASAAHYAASASFADASRIASSSSRAAAAAASFSASAVGSAIWRSVSLDAQWLLKREDAPSAEQAKSLLSLSVWHGRAPSWARNALKRLSAATSADSTHWSDWIAWHGTVAPIDGDPLGVYFSEALELRIATQPDDWWDRGAEAVNADIAKWVEEERGHPSTDTGDLPNPEEDSLPESGPAGDTWDFFLSYSTRDEAIAREISAIVEGAGYSVFAQFKDFVPGSNFVREMQRGLAATSRVIALYSPDYEASGNCQAEWAAAYAADPGGAKRRLLPFLIRPTELNPLARQIVYTNLVGLGANEMKAAVLDALSRGQGPARSKESFAKAAIDVASPVLAERREGGTSKIDAVPNSSVDKAFPEGDLHELPGLQRVVIVTIVDSLPGNAPPVVRNSLRRYDEHLTARGTRPFTTLLRTFAASVQQEYASTEVEFWGGGLNSLFEDFFRYHSLFMQHFPLADKVERLVEETQIDEDAAQGPALSEPMEEVKEAAEEASEAGLTTSDFDRTVEILADEGRDLASVGTSGDKSRKATKRYIIGTIGFLGALYAFLGNTASIGATPQGQALMRAAWDAMQRLLSLVL